jgi:hypothetical protein
MSLLNGLLGNASEINPQQALADYGTIFAPNEKIQKAYQIFRDVFIFTDKRLILIDRQGITGNKVEYHSVPYKSITHFSVETAGTFDLDAELKIWISGNPVPIQKRFNKNVNIYVVQQVLAFFVLK